MASTYSPQDALNLVKAYAHGIPVDVVQSNVCDIVHSMLWVFYPWRWSISPLTQITCVNGQQDYSPLDNDILRPLRIQLIRTDVSPNEVRELALLANLSVELARQGGLETITSAGWYPTSNIIRLLYAASVSGTQILKIQGFYQKTPIKITDSNLTTPFLFPDHYFGTFVEGLKWKIYQLSDDPRAGSIQYSKNGSSERVYTGQLGMFMDSMLAMARTEDLGQGDEFSFPEQPIGVGRSYWPGLYGV